MDGKLKPYLPELTIRDYNMYQRYLRGVRRQMHLSYGLWSCRLLRHNGVLFALLSDSLAGREATCRKMRTIDNICRRPVMCETQGIRQAAQIEMLMGWHNLQDRTFGELKLKKRVVRALDWLLLRRAYQKAVEENPALERIMVQERAQALAQRDVSAKSYEVAAEPMSNVFGAIYSVISTDDLSQRKSLRYIGSSVGRILYLTGKAQRYDEDKSAGRYNVFEANGVPTREAAEENARRQSLAAANDIVRVYSLLDVKLNRTLLDNIMILGLRYAIDPAGEPDDTPSLELP